MANEPKREVWVVEHKGVPQGNSKYYADEYRLENFGETPDAVSVRYVPAASDQAGKAPKLDPLETLLAHHNNGTVFCFEYEGYGAPVSLWPMDSSASGEGPTVVEAARDLCAKLDIPVEASASGKAQAEWVAVGERLPEEGALVLVYETGWTEPAIGHHVGGVWLAEDDDDDQLAVTHWMPLPPPPSSSTPGSSDG
jgi:hypothetical protein